jgi:hypothetical protein
MARLWELAALVRSKNAGPFMLTFDIIFADEKVYRQVKASGTLNRGLFARLYGVPEAEVLFFEYDPALAFKASIPRPVPAGDLGDTDVFGGQQHGPLADLEITLAEEGDGAADDQAPAAP